MFDGLQNNLIQLHPRSARGRELTRLGTTAMSLESPSVKGIDFGRWQLTVQDRSEVLHLPQTLGADLSVGAKGFQHFVSESSEDTRVVSEHCHRERC